MREESAWAHKLPTRFRPPPPPPPPPPPRRRRRRYLRLPQIQQPLPQPQRASTAARALVEYDLRCIERQLFDKPCVCSSMELGCYTCVFKRPKGQATAPRQSFQATPRAQEYNLTLRATNAHPTSPRSTGFCAIWDCISSSSSSGVPVIFRLSAGARVYDWHVVQRNKARSPWVDVRIHLARPCQLRIGGA